MNLNLNRKCLTAALTVNFVFMVGSSALAGTFNWGDLSDPAGNIMYLGVEETNTYANALFDKNPGSGSPDVIGNQIFFDPQNFLSLTNGPGSNITDSTLTTTLMAKQGTFINNISVSEFGDHTLSGLTGGQAEAHVGAAFFWTILEINNLPNPQPTQTAIMQFTPGTGVGPDGGHYARPGDNGNAIPWTGSVFINVDGYLLANVINGRATKVRLRFDNALSTAADAVSSAFIKKKEIAGVVVTPNIPEPASCLLLFAALAPLALLRRQRG
jgi:hypothetical protein